MSLQYMRNDVGGVRVIPVFFDHHQHSSSFMMNSSNSNSISKAVFSPSSPLESAQQAWSSSQSSGSPPPSANGNGFSAESKPCYEGGHRGFAAAQQNSGFQQESKPCLLLTLKEIESRLLDDDDDFNNNDNGSAAAAQQLIFQGSIQEEISEADVSKELIDRMGDPKQLLVLCAEAISNNNFGLADLIIARLNQVVNIYGTPMQRLAAYMVEGLVARVQSSGTGLCRALRCKEPQGNDILSAMQVMYEVCPYIKFGYMAANGAIAEAFKDEHKVHIIDFEIAQGTQYIALIQALALRPGGPPHVRITGVGDPMADVAHPRGVQFVGQRLAKLAQSVNVPFEFHAVPVSAAFVHPGMLERRNGEALAVNFAMQLHHMPDESVSVSNPRDRLLRIAKSLGPKIVTLVEQEANTNTAPFLARFKESLSYYAAVFESLDVTLPRESKERVSVEQHCLARDLVNLIACEGSERIERHEVMGKWRSRMTMAGFKQCPLSGFVNHTIKCLLKSYCDNYKLTEENGVIYLGWLERSLVAASAWS